ncbi:unnamed protein product, partial [Polarella glacialis]
MAPAVSWKTAAAVAVAALACKRADLFWNNGRSIPLLSFWREPGFSYDQLPDLSGKVALVTGANTGLGRETALQLALANATVLMGCRDMGRCEAAVSELRAEALRVKGLSSRYPQLKAVYIDLADLRQVATAADALFMELDALHILVNNAGVATQFPHTLTRDGVELTFQANYLGHFLLTTLLLPLLERSAPARVVHLSSGAHRGAPLEGVPLSREGVNDPETPGPYARYGMAKLANLVFARELDRRFFSKGIFSNAVHPGVVATDMLRPQNFEAMLGPQLGPLALGLARLRNSLFAYSPQQAALSLLYCAASPEVETLAVHGELVVPVATRWQARHPMAEDADFGKALWRFSQQLVSEAL